MSTIGNRLLQLINRPVTRNLTAKLISWKYAGQGQNIELVRYHNKLKVWEFRIDGVSYLSYGPGWTFNYKYLLDRIKSLSGFSYLPKPGDSVIDIGAGIGEETIIFQSLVGDNGKVYAIEAHPRTHETLQYLIEVNCLQNVISSNIALADEPGMVSIDDSDNSFANTILPTQKGKSFQVAAETFDDYAKRHNIHTIDLVKMNVEGAEKLIIKGMVKSLPGIRHLAISCHDFRFKSGESEFYKTKELVMQFLKDHKFSVTTQNTGIDMVDDYVYAVNPMFAEAQSST